MEVTALEWGSLSLRDRVTVSGRDLIILMFTWPSPPCDIQYAAFVVHNLFLGPFEWQEMRKYLHKIRWTGNGGQPLKTPVSHRQSLMVFTSTDAMWHFQCGFFCCEDWDGDRKEWQVCSWTSVKFAYAAPNSGGLQHLAFKSAITVLSQQSIIFSIIKRAVIYIRIVQNKGGELGLCWDCLGVSTLVGWKIIWSIHHNLLEHGKTSLMNCYKIWRRYSWLPDDEPYTLCWTPFLSSNRVFEMFGFKWTVSTAGGQIAIKPGSHIHALFWMNCNIFSNPLTDRVIDGVVMVKGQIFNV